MVLEEEAVGEAPPGPTGRVEGHSSPEQGRGQEKDEEGTCQEPGGHPCDAAPKTEVSGLHGQLRQAGLGWHVRAHPSSQIGSGVQAQRPWLETGRCGQ